MRGRRKGLSIVLVVAILISLVPISSLYTKAAVYYLFPVQGGKLAYYYGYTESYGGYHNGIDIHSSGNDNIYAAYGGKVEAIANSCQHVNSYPNGCEHTNTFGNYIRIKQDDGRYAYYGHLKYGGVLVSVGDYVKKGQLIGIMGSSGFSSGKHLHFEVRSSTSTSSHININPDAGNVTYSYSGYGGDSYSYTSITPGTYYLKNKETGKFLNVSYGLDENQQNIHVYDYGSYTSEQFQITSTGNGYKMRPLCSSSRVVNAWGDNPSEGSNVNLYDDVSNSTQWWKFEAVSGGYIIHNVYNPSLVLDIGDSGVLVWTRHGGASQIWTLVPLNHTCDKGTYQYYWEAHPHYNCYKCSICEEIWEDTNSSNDVSSCEVCNPPHSCTFAGKTEIITEATCTETGSKKVYCTDASCGKYETVSIAAKGHQYTKVIIAPTPTAQGYTEHTCSACGDIYKDNYTDYVNDDAPQLVMESITASAGKEISVKLSLQNNTGIAGLAISLKYDESVLTLKEVRKGNLFSGFTSGKNLVWDESKDVTADGILATVVFTVADNASAGDYKIEIITRSCTNANLEDVVPVTTAGIITIIDYLYGDANGDGDIDMKDIVLLQKYMANFDYDLNTSTVEVKAGADANGDGKVSGQDIVRLRRYLSEYDYETGSSTVVLGP